jgi:hypothetical protein
MTGDWILLRTFPLEYQAELLKAALAEEGIESFIINRRDSAYRFIGEIEVYVKKGDYLLAQHVAEKTEL